MTTILAHNDSLTITEAVVMVITFIAFLIFLAWTIR